MLHPRLPPDLFYARNKPPECFLAFRCPLVDTGMLQHLHKDNADLVLDNLVDRLIGKAAIFLLQLLDPVRMLAKLLVVPDVASADNRAL